MTVIFGDMHQDFGWNIFRDRSPGIVVDNVSGCG